MAMAVALLILLVATPAVYAAQYTVGGTTGWTNTGYNYTTWAAGEKFVVGDTLLFTYGPSHAVDVVSQSDYTNCVSSNAIKSYSGGTNDISLSTAGTMYFICPTPGHCTAGMKLAVTVAAATGTTPSSPSGSPPATNTTSPPPPPSSSGVSCNFCNMSLLMAGLSIVIAAVVSFMG